MQSFYYVRLSGQWMLASGTLPARHLTLDGLEPLQHLVLETLEGAVQDVGTDLLKPLACLWNNKKHYRTGFKDFHSLYLKALNIVLYIYFKEVMSEILP